MTLTIAVVAVQVVPETVVFYCPGTPEKPRHPCTLEALAAITYALDAPTDDLVFGALGKAAPPGATPQAIEVPYTELLNRVANKLNAGHLRVQVKCTYCATLSILTDALLKEPRVENGATVGSVNLMPPTAADEALADAAKSVSGAEALKASMGNAVFVTGNLALLTTLVTALGLSKQEEIGAKLTENVLLGILLILAVTAGTLAIIFALWAMLVRKRSVQLGNLEAVREAVNSEISDRSQKAGYSLVAFGAALALVSIAFIVLTGMKLNEKDKPLAGTLSVTVVGGTPDVAIETSWKNADAEAELVLQVSGDAMAQEFKDVVDGAAEIKRIVRPTPTDRTAAQIDVLSQLVKGGDPVAGAVKRACFTIQATGVAEARDC